MEAVAEIFKSNKNTEFIIVGGYDPNTENDVSQKVTDMECFLKERCENINIKSIKSLPCTFHNFVAIFNTWEIKRGFTFIMTTMLRLPTQQLPLLKPSEKNTPSRGLSSSAGERTKF